MCQLPKIVYFLCVLNCCIQRKVTSVADYLDRMNAITDNLALAEQPVGDDELVQMSLNNLGSVFEMTVNATHARDTLITCPTLEAIMSTT